MAFSEDYLSGGMTPAAGQSAAKRVLNFADEQQIFSYLALGALDDGGFIVTWTARAGNHTDVFARQFDSAGQRVGREFRVNTQRLRAQSNSSVTGLNDGGFVVAWNSAGQDDPRFSELANHGIFAQRYDNTGQPVGTEFQVNTYTPDYQTRPKVARLADGGFVVTWQSLYQDTSPNAVSGYGIYGQRYNGAGNPVGSEFRVNTWTTYDQQNCSIAGLNDGGFVVTWQSRSRPDVHEDFSDNISGQLFGP